MTYNTYLFDFDGTLVDSMPSYVSVMLRILDENGVAYTDDIIKIITPLGYTGTAKYYIEKLGLNLPVETIVAQMNQYAYNEYAYKIQAKSNVIDTLQKLKAERERREAILRAEGEKNSAILRAEGEKQSIILAAEAAKQSKILAAEAQRQARICEAEGEAEAILRVQSATAEGIKLINEAAPTQGYLTIKSLEAFAKAADGQATKIIIPSEIQGVAGLVSSINAMVDGK